MMDEGGISYELAACLLAFQRGEHSEDAEVGAYLEAEKLIMLRAFMKG